MFNVKSKPIASAILLGFLFVAVSLGLVASGRGIPAVFDGNETFSSILHAKNLLAFGPKVAAGLADESTSARLESHPVVHTHQGNFPRLYATVLSALGLNQPVSQVVATVLPIGLIGVLLLFWALYRYAGLEFAVVAVVVLLTDYILFAQWQVVTYRLWHFAFTAAFLAITISYRATGRRSLLAAVFVTSVFLFYYELVFATFLAVSISTFALLLWRREIVTGIIFVGVQFAGAVTGACLLVAQLISYLGWDGFITDLRLTYISRNTGIADPAKLDELRTFVEQNNIAFFYNFIDGSGLRSVSFILDTIFRWGLQVYTPPFSYCILVLSFGIGVALFARNGAVRLPKYVIAGIAVMTALGWLFGSSSVIFLAITLGVGLTIFAAPDSRRSPQHIGFIDAAMIIAPPGIVFLLMATTFSRFPGFEHAFGGFWEYGLVFAVTLAALVVLLIVRSMPERQGRLPLDAVLRGASILCAAAAFSRFHHRLYDESLAPLWEHSLPGSFMPVFLQSKGMVLATTCAAAIAALGPYLQDQVKMPLRETAQRVIALIGSFLVGLLVVVVLFPGYVYSGYMARYLNFLVLPFALSIGLVFYSMAVIGKYLIADTVRGVQGPFPLAARAVCLLLPAFLVAWWAAIQTANARLFPANGLAVLNALEALAPPPPRTVANSYPVPFAVTTGQWSYLDETFSSGRVVFSPASGYGHRFDRKYLWFADRAENPEYNKPDAFVCLLTPTYRTSALQVAKPEKVSRCADNGIVQLTQRHADKTWPHHVISSRDPSGRDAWAIVKLDWDFPPYLAAKPKIAAALTGESVALTATYDFRHQDGKPEYQTDIEIWPVAQNGSFCAVQGTPLATRKANGGRTMLVLAQPDIGKDLIVLARPQTATRIGAPFFTTPFRIEGGASVAVGQPCGILRDAGGHHWPRIEGD